VTVDVAAAKAALPLSSLFAGTVKLVRAGREYSGLCPFHSEKSPSFYVNDAKGVYKCFGCGAGGDHVDALRALYSLDARTAIADLAQRAGLAPGQAAPRVARVAQPVAVEETVDRIEVARAIWRGAKGGDLAPVVGYLAGRGITIAPPASLRCGHRVPYRPYQNAGQMVAMVAPLVAVDGHLTGVHCTYLARAAGSGRWGKADRDPAKKMVGEAYGSAIRLSPAAEHLLIAEGIETGLSVLQALPHAALWVAGSLGNIAGSGERGAPCRLHPRRTVISAGQVRPMSLPTEIPDRDRPGLLLPPIVRRVTILADADGDRYITSALLRRAARRWDRAGLDVAIASPPPGCDFNDVLRARLVPALVRA
jgi:DNA primase